MSRKRRRCSKHIDMLVPWDERCPKCELDKVKEQNKVLREKLAIYGDPVMVRVAYPTDRVMRKMLRVLALYPLKEYQMETIPAGIVGSSDEYVLPRKLAEAVMDVADDFVKELNRVRKDAVEDGIRRVDHCIKTLIEHLSDLHVEPILREAVMVANKEKPHNHTWSMERAIKDGIDAQEVINDLWGRLATASPGSSRERRTSDRGRNQKAQGRHRQTVS